MELKTTYSFQVLYVDWFEIAVFDSYDRAFFEYNEWDHRPTSQRRIVEIRKTVLL